MENLTDYEYPTHVNAAFANPSDAEKAYNELLKRNYLPDEINVLLSDSMHQVHITSDTDDSEKDNTGKTAAGSAVGGTTGAIIGALATLATAVLIPPLGIAVGGPMLAAFTVAGAGAGGISGGIIGALVGSGISKEHAEMYENTLKEGGTIISFTPKTVEDRLEIITVWNSLGGKQLHGNESYTD
ncbi:hypothetical protein [Dyadobacter sp. NIV53]|uniref:hypothetical protein n=1 Tax=Dyadobacter sp. NIV53 TaxID=2861765 RepID=UPI001C87BE17|nr:hypothetical protein [Dyadobacter sp. NIV53]